MLQTMLADSPGKTVKQVLCDDFSRVSPAIAQEVCAMAKVNPKAPADRLHGEELERLHKALGEVRVMAPPATAVVPIGEGLLIEGLKRRFPRAEFYTSTTRAPKVYRGNPFVVEAALAYGGDLPLDEPAEIMRLANRVPLQYQPKACAISESVYDVNWRGYELQQPKGSLPVAPMAVVVHLASVWVPFTSEAKEAVAHYDELLEEMKHALRECGRKLASHVRSRAHADRELKRRSLFEKYIPEVAAAIGDILGISKEKIEKPFFATLPVFVKFADEDGTPKGGKDENTDNAGNGPDAEEGAEAPATPSRAAASPAAAKGKGKDGNRGKGKQLSLLE
jgi:DNA topoisomerase-6 subunit B